ncbi:ATP-dependent helicase HepA [Microbispora rosea]|uniref:ATP-dependent helicase HepA n=1 Tax=Microbispora rosea TaxID=58117 RepID=A0A1N7HID6_9ACTN|nr:protein DpdE [Microbispora rosea]GIH51958.1 hypothetical protein Mro03_71370 [Microbispora rosea subsp. rosea]SIS24440.1 ATP-dependent helicase HepA [Microbispora rosea]
MPDRFTVGRLVEYADSPGIGRVGDLTETSARVDFFESVAEPVAYSQIVPLSKLRGVVLEAETRVYRRNPDTGDWLAGRVRGYVGHTHYVTFPNVDYDFPVSEDELRVRWDRPVANPVTVLTAGGNESGYYYNARLPFLHNLVSQRGASASTSALLSSAVELFPHQIRAALTVLSDPVQRYLLADEVGLGKTIEAGFVIRQTLIDNPQARICIVAPDVLRRQWIGELRAKFFIHDFPAAKIKVLSHETPERWSNYLAWDLVVVDEVHRLVQVTSPEESPYKQLTALAHSVPRLLLLSATPVMSRYTAQLAMLHLLDQSLYRWDDRAAFQKKYELRSQLANSVFLLDSTYTYALPAAIEEIRQLLPSTDQRFAELSQKVIDLLDENDELRTNVDEAELKKRTESLRGHISEAYRLHRRVIRHRRHTVLQDDPNSEFMPYEVRGRREPHVLQVSDGTMETTQAIVEQWRSQVWDHLLDEGLEEHKTPYAMVLAVLASRASLPISDLEDALAWRVLRDERAASRAGLTAAERTLLLKPEVLSLEHALLEEIRTQSAFTDFQAQSDRVIDAMLPALRRSRRSTIFCGPGMLAPTLVERFKKRFRGVSVHEHTHRVGADEAERSVHEWSTGTRQSVLIADGTAEDGLNLQSTDAVFHVRLPWSPNQLEQRLGRVDRYQSDQTSAAHPAASYRIGAFDSDASYIDSWAQLLAEGYGIFAQSVSTLQDAISESLPNVWTAALEGGPEQLRNSAPTVHMALAAARQEIDKMDMLEAIHETSIETHDIAHSLLALESEWTGARRTMLDYVSGSGGIKLVHTQRTIDDCQRDVFDIAHSHPTMDPRQWSQARARLSPEHTQGAFNRSAVLRAPGTRIFRAGSPLVEVLARAVHLDDRGQASAFRRIDHELHGDPIAYFGFDFLVEADLSDALELVIDHTEAMHAIRRQADRLLPPFTLKVWIEAGRKTPITTSTALTWLNKPYDKGPDQNYNKKRLPELLDLLGGWDGYTQAANLSEQTARAHLNKVTDLATRCAQAQEQAWQRVAIARAQAQVRRDAGHLVGDAESLVTDIAVTDALIAGLTRPTIKLIAATCLVRAGLRRIKP